ncbi:MAG: ankyrin repeat domain-containing protein [Desulfobacterales bacterium]|nr:ankyrin repeat domain-containing protein [Desulfobacterales bacterium]
MAKTKHKKLQLSNIAELIVEYCYAKGEKIRIHDSIEDVNLGIVLEKIFKDRSIHYDTEIADSVSIYASLLKAYAKITCGDWEVSAVEILGPDESDICDYDEILLRFNSSNGLNEWLISGIDSDYISNAFYENLEKFSNQHLSGVFRNIPTFDQTVSTLYLSKNLSLILTDLLNSKDMASELCATGQADYILWLYEEIGDNVDDVCGHFGFTFKSYQKSFHKDTIEEEEQKSSEEENINKKLIASIKTGNIAEIKRALKNGADINFDDPPPLLTAAEKNDLELVDLLLKYGANPNQSQFSFSALSVAATHHQNFPMVKALIKAGADPNSYHYSASVLCHTCYHNKQEDGEWKKYPISENSFKIARFLLESGATANGKRGDHPGCPLQAPIIANDLKTVQLLIDYNAKLTVSPVLVAANWCAYEGRYQMLELLLNNGFKPNPRKAKDKLFASPLHYAIAKGHNNIVELLLRHKADYNYVPNYSPLNHLLQHLVYEAHPLIVAIENNRFKIMKMLLEAGACPNGLSDTNKAYVPPIVLAVSNENLSMIKILIEHGADINASQDKDVWSEYAGKTALDVGIEKDISRETLKFLHDNCARSSDNN